MLSNDLGSCCSHCVGFLISLASAFFTALNGLTFVYLEPYGFNAVVCNFYRFALMTLFSLFVVLLKGEALIVKRPLLWLGSFFFSCKSLLFYLAITYSELYADVYAINTLQVAFVALLGWLILGERCDLVDLFLIALIMVGAVIVIQPQFIRNMLHAPESAENRCDKPTHIWENRTSELDQYFNSTDGTVHIELHQIPGYRNDTVKGGLQNELTNLSNTTTSLETLSTSFVSNVTNISYEIRQNASRVSGKHVIECNRLLSGLLAVLSTVSMAIFYVCLRTTKDLFLGTVVLYKNLTGVVMTVILASSLRMWSFPAQAVPWLMLLSLCLSGGLSFGLSVIALRREKAAVVSIGRTSQVIFSYLMEITILQHLPNVLSSVGASVTVVASLVFFLRRLYISDEDDGKNEHTPILNGAASTDVAEKYGMDNLGNTADEAKLAEPPK